MAMLYRPLAFFPSFHRETCVFPLVGLEKPLEIFKPFLVNLITSAKPTNTPNLVGIGSQGAPPHSGEMSRFVTIVLPFFKYFFPFPHLA